ncbi:MAG: ABC transporter permease [Actinobacteria bacterium]|nr:ABC transporter permease [Actinomycetota bacterium]
MSRVRSLVAPVGVTVALVALWQLVVQGAHVHPWMLPAPSSVASSGWESRSSIMTNAVTTIEEAVAGLVIGSFAGVALAFVISLVPVVRRAVWPLVVTSQTIPVIVLAPLVAVWFGYGITPKVVLVALTAFFPVTVATVAGLAGADPELIELVRSFGASSSQVLRTVRIPAALEHIVAGVRIAAAYAVGSAVIGEYVGGTSGLGIFIDQAHRSYRTDSMLAGVAVIAISSIVLFGLVGVIGRRLTPWRDNPTPENRLIGIDT